MLVDNAVVVLESIFRCREEGDGPKDAAVRGVGEVGTAVIVSTLTTVAVFFPIVFVEGVAGQLFGDLALTVVLSLLASLIVALFVVPMLAARVPDAKRLPQPRRSLKALLPDLRHWSAWESARAEWAEIAARWQGARWGRVWMVPWIGVSALYRVPRTAVLLVLELVLVKGIVRLLGALLMGVAAVGLGLWWAAGKVLWPFGWVFDKGFGLLERGYTAVLRGALRQRLLVLLVAAAGSWWAVNESQELGVELVPTMHQGELLVDLTLPVETSLTETASRVAKIEGQLVREGVQRVFSFMGQRDEAGQDEGGDNHAQITLTLPPGDGMTSREEDAMSHIRAVLDQQPGIAYHIRRPTLFSLKTPIAVELRSDQLPLLRQSSTQTLAALAGLDSIKDLRSSLSRGYPELHVQLDREALAFRNLTARDVANSVQQQVLGQSPTRLRSQEKRVDVIVRLARDAIQDTADLHRLTIKAGSSSASRPVSLAEVAGLPPPVEGPSEIRRIEGQRAVVIEATPNGLDLSAAMAEVDAAMQALALPQGVRFAITGQREELESAKRNLLLAFGLAVFLVYIVMASQFEALVAPFVIMFSIPLSGIGVVAALSWAQATVSVVAFIGVIMLAGIVVNNAIILVDYIIQLRDRGLDKRAAIVQACSVRLRPVLITTLTTVLGLIPMALGLGEGAEIRTPMALTVMGGLSSSTLLTLLVVPVFYDLIGELGRRKAPPATPTNPAENIDD